MPAALDIDLLRTFHAVARLGQFRAAAEHVHRSPASVSVHIQKLETIVGGRLLERDNQSVALTALGQRLLTGTASLLRTHDNVMNELLGTSLAGRVKLGVPDEYAPHVIRDILPRFTATWPHIVLEVITSPSLSLQEQIQRGRLHLAIVAQPLGAQRDARTMTTTAPVWVGGLGMAKRFPDPLPLALPAAHCPYARAMTNSLDQAGMPWRVAVTSPSSLVLETAIESGLGVSLIDRTRVSPQMQLLEGLPRIAPHEVKLLRAEKAQASPVADQLEKVIWDGFRL